MKLSRRHFFQLTTGTVLLSLKAEAQAYPSKPVRIIVGFGPGGPVDIVARIIGQWLTERLGQPFVIENRPGAGSNIAAEAAVRAPPDGYTLLMINNVNTWNPSLYDNLNFDFVRDITPIASIERGANVIEVNRSFPAKTLPEFISYAKAHPGKINMGAVSGGATHLYGELFKNLAGVDIVPVYYRGPAPAMADLIAGQVDVMFDSLISSVEHIKAGELRALAVTSATRVDVLPDVPAVGEFVEGFEATGWGGIGAPKNTPASITDRLNMEINAGLADPKIRARIGGLGASAFVTSRLDFQKFIIAETVKWNKVIRGAGIKIK